MEKIWQHWLQGLNSDDDNDNDYVNFVLNFTRKMRNCEIH